MCRISRGCLRTLSSRTAEGNLDCVFVENALLFFVPKVGRAQPPPLYDPLVNV